jgi:LPS sulfotransferase NodH
MTGQKIGVVSMKVLAHFRSMLSKEAFARALLGLRSMRGGSTYTKFVIVGIARTGSTMLISQLNSHSQALAFGEIFRSPDSIGWDVSPFRSYQNQELLALYNVDPIAFLEKHVFRNWPRNYKAVGFKLFYYHARTPSQRSVWDYLVVRPEIRVLHIKRRNMLGQYVSLQLAHKTNLWSSVHPVTPNHQPIQLDIQACHSHFAWVRRLEDECEAIFKNHNVKSVFYEDLAREKEEIDSIQTFLGLRHEKLNAQTVRQQNKPLSHVIANYAELRDACIGTEWERFFEHPSPAD